jgi:hypothetical protein
MSFSQVCRAWVNRVELVSMLEGMGKWTLPPEKAGSGKLVMPCERMQAAALR